MTTNQAVLPRVSDQKTSSRTYVRWAVACLVVAVGASWPIYSAWHEVQQARYRTARVPGRLDSKFVRHSQSRGLSVHYDITYRFEPQATPLLSPVDFTKWHHGGRNAP